jgi:hypothetical protein
VAAGILMIDPGAVLPALLSVFALIAFHLAVGWKLYRLGSVRGRSPATDVSDADGHTVRVDAGALRP